MFDWFAFVDQLKDAVDEINLMSAIDRLKQKALKARGVVPRAVANAEAEMDAIIGAEPELQKLTQEAVAPHKAAIAETREQMEGFKDALNIMSNGGPELEDRPTATVPPVRGYPV